MRYLSVLAVVAMISARALPAQLPQHLCNASLEPIPDSLVATAKRLYPEISAPEKQKALVSVAFLIDGNCRIVAHNIGTRPGVQNVSSAMAQLIPGTQENSYTLSGFISVFAMSIDEQRQADRARGNPIDFGSPMIVWGLLARGLQK